MVGIELKRPSQLRRPFPALGYILPRETGWQDAQSDSDLPIVTDLLNVAVREGRCYLRRGPEEAWECFMPLARIIHKPTLGRSATEGRATPYPHLRVGLVSRTLRSGAGTVNNPA